MRFLPTTSVEFIHTLNHHQAFPPIDHERFQAKFGVTVIVAIQTWNAIILNLNKSEVPSKGYRHLIPVYILYASFFTKYYPTVRKSVGIFGHNLLGIHNFQKYSYLVIGQIAGLLDEVVSSSKIEIFPLN